MIRFSLLGSGSRGNAIFVSSCECKVLIDSGFSFRQLKHRLLSIGENVETLDAVFITHEHSDHIKGIRTLIKNINVPVFLTEATMRAIVQEGGMLQNIQLFEAGDSISLYDMDVTSFSVSHDAVDPVNYVVCSNGVRLGIAADLGYVSTLALARLRNAHALVLEANHCPNMLLNGKYPPMVKQRILGKSGHLSNQAMKECLARLLHPDLKLIVLAHISQDNNTPDLALRSAQSVLSGTTIPVHVAQQDKPTPVFEISL